VYSRTAHGRTVSRHLSCVGGCRGCAGGGESATKARRRPVPSLLHHRRPFARFARNQCISMPPAETPKVLSAEPGGKQHWSIDVAFPVYAIAFTDDRTVVLAGGGGSSRTGVKNRLVSARIWLAASGARAGGLLLVESRRTQLVAPALLGWLPCAWHDACGSSASLGAVCRPSVMDTLGFASSPLQQLTTTRVSQSTFQIDLKRRQFDLVQEHELSKSEDAPMTLAVEYSVRPSEWREQVDSELIYGRQSKTIVAGINSSEAKMKEGINENLRVFSYGDEG
jgi:hypothetical protein